MIKVESNMLILDATLSKQDAAAINEFIDIAKKEEQERIIKLLDECLDWSYDIGIADKKSGCQIDVEQLIYLIKGEQK